MWILILTISYLSQGGVTSQQVTGFDSQQACLTAGKQAQDDLNGLATSVKYSCIQKE